MCPTHSEARQTETYDFGAQKGLLQGHSRRMGGSCPPRPHTLLGFQQSIFKGKVRGGLWLVVPNFLVWESFVLAAVHIGPVNLQQDKCYSLCCNFLSLYEWKKMLCVFQATSLKQKTIECEG